MSIHVIEFNNAVAAARSGPEMFKVVEQALIPFGVAHFSYRALSAIEGQVTVKKVDLYHVSYPAAVQRAVGGLNRYSDDLTTFRADLGLDTRWTNYALWKDATDVQKSQNHREIDAGVRLGYTHFLGSFGMKKASIGLDMSILSRRDFENLWPSLSTIILSMAQIMHLHFTKDHMPKHYSLSPREKDVLSWLVMGLRPDEIAEKLSVGYRSVDKYIVSAKEKLGANSRDHAVARAITLGLLDL